MGVRPQLVGGVPESVFEVFEVGGHEVGSRVVLELIIWLRIRLDYMTIPSPAHAAQ